MKNNKTMLDEKPVNPIKALRFKLNNKTGLFHQTIDQIPFAKLYGATQPTLSKIEKNLLDPPIPFLVALLDAKTINNKKLIEIMRYFAPIKLKRTSRVIRTESEMLSEVLDEAFEKLTTPQTFSDGADEKEMKQMVRVRWL